MRPRGRIIVLCVGELPKSGFVPRRRRFPANQCRRERGGSCWETKPILSGFDFDRREIEAVYKFIWLSGVSLNSFRFCTNLDWIWSSLVAEISYTRAQSENANYFRALLQPPMTRNFLCAACIMLFIHNDETTYKRPETINSRLVFCILSLFTRSHCSWRSFFSKSLPLSTRWMDSSNCTTYELNVLLVSHGASDAWLFQWRQLITQVFCNVGVSQSHTGWVTKLFPGVQHKKNEFILSSVTTQKNVVSHINILWGKCDEFSIVSV